MFWKKNTSKIYAVAKELSIQSHFSACEALHIRLEKKLASCVLWLILGTDDASENCVNFSSRK